MNHFNHHLPTNTICICINSTYLGRALLMVAVGDDSKNNRKSFNVHANTLQFVCNIVMFEQCWVKCQRFWLSSNRSKQERCSSNSMNSGTNCMLCGTASKHHQTKCQYWGHVLLDVCTSFKIFFFCSSDDSRANSVNDFAVQLGRFWREKIGFMGLSFICAFSSAF